MGERYHVMKKRLERMCICTSKSYTQNHQHDECLNILCYA